ncbi:hypothetical protein LR48_Vigan464s001000 [Vigna angularis]|uniref:Uncharacterized protein n=2 Tax=Phaseolus angularis TaxID=3914 RepID=A0A0L9TB81_PHAAN|nr:adhesin AWP3b isoform X2 [Vigna angularis]XP_052736954.1 adhesin AWP3b isoform X2 [Vigna angularis]XP_052736957.1 adhesin AWP3b isoform X2 [Vigna angularis]XP_052736962.1 adhesin AWP3b isoform X2 [Vigna angularis]BAT74045.1 hypothetical protein VIGAN_01163100 [Vigna angularis var. angularis]KAG2409885.1 uncharacterized protein HKW66_Vig0005500 [Vigna angularis]KOM27813.1 hypothetical protein LR48_Vigan464s001000 [Vigna angularis]
MEGGDHTLAPQWLKSSGNDSKVTGTNNQFTSPYSDQMTYTSRNPSFSRPHSSYERSWPGMDGEKDIDNDGLTSASHDIPMTVGIRSKAMMMQQYNISSSTSSMGLSMAETLAQSPHHSYSPSQLSSSTQKLEELALKQSRLLIPVTPSTPRSLAASSLEKSKAKTGRQQYPFYSRRLGYSLQGAHPNSDIQKTSSVNSHNFSASRELNGVSSVVKDNLLSPNSRSLAAPVGATRSTSIAAPSRSLGNNNSTPSSWITLEKKPTFPTQSRNDFFKNLSRKSSMEKPSSDVLPIDMSCSSEKSEASTTNVSSSPILKSRDASSVDSSSLNTVSDCSSIITVNDNAANEPLKPSSSGENQHISNPFPFTEEEEIAFLRSLGWQESAGDDEGLTEEEIQNFYEQHMKLQP